MDRHQRHYYNPFVTAARGLNDDLPANYPTPYRAQPTADQFQHERDRGQQERGGDGVHVAETPTPQPPQMDPVQLHPIQPYSFADLLRSPPTRYSDESWEGFARRLYGLLNPNANLQDDNAIADWFDRDARDQYMETFRHFLYPDEYLRLGEIFRRPAQMRMQDGHGGVQGVRHGEVPCVGQLEVYCPRHDVVHRYRQGTLHGGGEFGILNGEEFSVVDGGGGEFGKLEGKHYSIVHRTQEYDF